jgi:organic radical activating enzyme
MWLKDIIEEDFTNYHLPSMFIATCYCNWKCAIDGGFDVEICQNHPIAQQPNINISTEEIYNSYMKNPITKAIVFGGLEPLLQFEEVLEVIKYFREHKCNDDIVIYTGYYENEIRSQIQELTKYSNIVIKYGRYKTNQQSHYDPILGVNLASNNQYAKKIS